MMKFGFKDYRECLEKLQKHDNDIEKAIGEILDKQ